jgi:hypothetical protein
MFVTILIALLVIDLLVFMAWDRYFLSIVILVGSAVGAYFLSDDIKAVVQALSWKDIATYSIAYLLIGMSVAVAKWFLFLFKVGRFITQCKEEFRARMDHAASHVNISFARFVLTRSYKRAYRIDDYNAPPLVDAYISDTNQHTDFSSEQLVDILTPSAKGYAARITSWIVQWPFVIIGLVLEDFILRFGEWVSDFIGMLFGRMAKLIIGNAIKGI